jgi:hypothetical protein
MPRLTGTEIMANHLIDAHWQFKEAAALMKATDEKSARDEKVLSHLCHGLAYLAEAHMDHLLKVERLVERLDQRTSPVPR